MRRGIPRPLNEDGMPICHRGHVITKKNTYNAPGIKNNPQCRECRRIARRLRAAATDDYTREYDDECHVNIKRINP